MSFVFNFFSGPGWFSSGSKNFVPLNALISAPAEAIGPAIHEGNEGEQHAEDPGLMDALRGGARAHLLNDLNAKSGLDCVAERIYSKRQLLRMDQLGNLLKNSFSREHASRINDSASSRSHPFQSLSLRA